MPLYLLLFLFNFSCVFQRLFFLTSLSQFVHAVYMDHIASLRYSLVIPPSHSTLPFQRTRSGSRPYQLHSCL